jgi:hypothetical protein
VSRVLTTQSDVRCGPAAGNSHGGVVATTSSAKLTVNGAPVLLEAGIRQSVSNCKTLSSSTSKPCSAVTTITTGRATKLTAGGSPVMLESVSGQTDGIPPGTVPASAKQDTLTAV